MALVDDMATDVQGYGYDDFVAADIIGFMNDTLQTIGTAEPWPYYETSVTLAGQSGTTLALPTDFHTPTKVIDLSTNTILEPTDRSTIVNNYTDNLTDSSDPNFYYMMGSASGPTLTTYPGMASSRSILLDYLRIPATMVAGGTTIDFPLRHKRLLILGAVVICSVKEGDLDMAAGYQAEYDRKMDAVRPDLWMVSQHDRPKFIHDVYWYGE